VHAARLPAALLTRDIGGRTGRPRSAAEAVRGVLGGVRGGCRPRRGGRGACLVEDPGPLVASLDACGSTLVHADIRDEQIGLEGDRLVLLDWGRATQAHPVLDFFWSLCHNGWRIDADHDELVEDFRRARGDHDDPYAVELGVIAGLVLYGWVFGHSAAYHPDREERDWARAELAWWVQRARRALENWSP
jgi:hypothetical protein